MEKIPLSAGARTVLVVEDDRSVRVFVERALLLQGYAVLAAGGPGEALGLFRARAAEIDLILSDVVMPELQGPELVRRLLALRPGIKAVYMSGYAPDEAARREIFIQGARFLEKPFSAETLARAIREALAG
jgi:two-component system, cell cycle sensor histidine kinase and response regulator CckA